MELVHEEFRELKNANTDVNRTFLRRVRLVRSTAIMSSENFLKVLNADEATNILALFSAMHNSTLRLLLKSSNVFPYTALLRS